jgi:DNA-binding NtrC family response regulator
VKRLLLTWSDRGIDGPTPAHQAKRPASDRGPVLRLLAETERARAYDQALVLSVPRGLSLARALAADMREHVREVDVRAIPLDDPSDHKELFAALAPLAREIERSFPRSAWNVDVLLSAGTPQAQTLWVILSQATMLRARLLQVIPAAFVPVPHPRAIREVSFDIEGFPEIRVLREEVTRLRAEVRARAPLIADSPAMRELMARVVRVAQSELPVLVTGETGSGKELVARALHEGSARSQGPFVAENCGALASSVLASELFGHEAGAFTGALGRHRGLFEQAHGGTIFLDEVGELPLNVQSMLLRVLQEGLVRRVGGERAFKVDARVVAATNRDLLAMVAEGTFREDLYYRLGGATLRVPPLRERVSDIPAMVRAFLAEATSARRARKLTVTPEVMRRLADHAWPGNVRELRSEVARWLVFCDDEVTCADLSPSIASAPSSPGGSATSPTSPGAAYERGEGEVRPLADVIAKVEREEITRALALHAGNLQRTAQALGIERNTLKRKLRGFGLYPASDRGSRASRIAGGSRAHGAKRSSGKRARDA